jgi:hypothetical protein
MDTTAVTAEEMTLRVARLSQPQERTGSIYVTLFELGRREADKTRCALKVVFAEVHIAFLVAAVRATPLARKAKTFHPRPV